MGKNFRALKDLRRVADSFREGPTWAENFSIGRYDGAWLDDGLIRWTSEPHRPRAKPRSIVRLQRVAPDLYLRFAALAEASEEEIVAFAGRWVPLLPRLGQSWEPVSEWRRLTRLTQALLHACSALTRGAATAWTHCRVISDFAFDIPLSAYVLRPDSDPIVLRSMIARALNTWHNEPATKQNLVEVVGQQIQLRPTAVQDRADL